MIDQLEPFAGSILQITGGDPLEREDLELIVTRARTRDLRVVLLLRATPRVSVHRLRRLFNVAGLAEVAMRLDGATPDVHDAMRGVRGSYRRTLDILQSARNVGFPLQITTTISRHNVGQIDEMAQIVAMTGAAVWNVGFLLPSNRERSPEVLNAAQHERTLRRLARLWDAMPFRISATTAPSFSRVMAQTHQYSSEFIGLASDGRGFMFISSTGDVRPSRLMSSAGNVRERSPVEIYRDAPLFRALRDPERLRGRCARCEYREPCGGNRAWAYVVTGDPFAEDPTCLFEPGGPITSV
jgi:radical SAM protein with 4Fe4S-binding SPASM domain